MLGTCRKYVAGILLFHTLNFICNLKKINRNRILPNVNLALFVANQEKKFHGMSSIDRYYTKQIAICTCRRENPGCLRRNHFLIFKQMTLNIMMIEGMGTRPGARKRDAFGT